MNLHILKHAIIAVALLAAGRWQIYSQGIMLSAGQTYTYEFSALPLQGVFSDFEGPNPPFGRLDGFFSAFAPGGAVVCEMFESSTDETAVASGTLYSPVGGLPAPPGPWMYADGAWQDLQGAVRFTMLSGSLTITRIRVSAVRSELGGFVEYASDIPEPGSIPLSLLGAACFWILRVRRQSCDGWAR